MDKLQLFSRKISGYENIEFIGGTKFRNGDKLFARITSCLVNGKTAEVSILEGDEVGFGSTEFIIMREKLGKNIMILFIFIYIGYLQKHSNKINDRNIGEAKGTKRCYRKFTNNLATIRRSKSNS